MAKLSSLHKIEKYGKETGEKSGKIGPFTVLWIFFLKIIRGGGGTSIRYAL